MQKRKSTEQNSRSPETTDIAEGGAIDLPHMGKWDVTVNIIQRSPFQLNNTVS